MFLGTALFVVVIVLVAPQSRLFLMTCLASAVGFIHDWAPFSYLLVMLLLASMFGAIYALKTWPQSQEPENPMAKYRREDPIDD
jgi:hypothetical protein